MIRTIIEKIKRASLLLLLCSAGFCFSGASLSFGEEKVSIAVLLSSPIGPYQEALRGFYKGVNESGIDYEVFKFTLDEDVDEKEAVSEIRRLKPDIIHTIGTKATRIVKEEFPLTHTVFSMVLNPVASGLVESMKSPGGNVTGVSMDIPARVQFENVKRILPKVKKIGVIYSEAETGVVVADAERAARSLGMEIVRAKVETPGDVPAALSELADKVDFLWSVADSKVFTRETIREVLLVTLREKIPFMGLSHSFVKAGALMAFKITPMDSGRQAAGMTERVLRGAKPAYTSVEVPEVVKIVLNGNTSRILGVNIPEEVYKSAEVVTP